MSMKEIFSKAWCEQLIVAWNNNPDLHKTFADAGYVIFEVKERNESRCCVLFWDKNGIMSLSEEHHKINAPHFSANIKEWYEFIKGAYSAVAGVMTGKIKYTGRMSFAFKFGAHFDHLAEVARSL